MLLDSGLASKTNPGVPPPGAADGRRDVPRVALELRVAAAGQGLCPHTRGHGESRWLARVGGKEPTSPRLDAGAKPEPRAANLASQERQEKCKAQPRSLG